MSRLSFLLLMTSALKISLHGLLLSTRCYIYDRLASNVYVHVTESKSIDLVKKLRFEFSPKFDIEVLAEIK